MYEYVLDKQCDYKSKIIDNNNLFCRKYLTDYASGMR